MSGAANAVVAAGVAKRRRGWWSGAALGAGLLLMVQGSGLAAEAPSPIVQQYTNLLTTYADHARSLWHETPDGGYWGDSFDAKNQNGAVRANCSTLLTYAMLVRGMDEDWLTPEDAKTLRRADLTRARMLDQIRKNLAYLAAHHKSAGEAAVAPQWGYHWQSSLWMQGMGPAALLTWKELGEELRADIIRVAAAEAEWVANRPPRDFVPGNTAAEENAWDTGAPAVALALAPESTSATLWWRALKSYTVNSYSHPADRHSSATIGRDVLSQIVTTANLSSDYTLDNHGFFHPDYMQVTGQHLGEAWLILRLGDMLHGTNLAEEFAPYSLHNVAPTWELVMRPLLLPTGEFAYPAGNDWTYHCSTNQSYFAFIGTALGSADAAEAELRALDHVKYRREIGPPGRLLGDTNLEWWWEPLVCKRMSTALLHHLLRPAEEKGAVPAPDATLDMLTTTVLFDKAKIWTHRTPDYFYSVSYGHPRLGYFVPFGDAGQELPYTTLPVVGGLLPAGGDAKWDFEWITENKDVPVVLFRREGKVVAGVACLPSSVVIVSREPLGEFGIENDTVTDGQRLVVSGEGNVKIKALGKEPDKTFAGPWINVDDGMGFVASGGFGWQNAKTWSQRSVAIDKVRAEGSPVALQMFSGNVERTREVGGQFLVKSGDDAVVCTVTDAVGEARYRVELRGDGLSVSRD